MDLEREIRENDDLVEKLSCLSTSPLAHIPVLFAKVKLTWQCNLSCRFCRRPQNTRPLSRDLVHGLLSSLTERGLRKVHFSGGEVFLHPETFGILDDACALGLQVNLTSNGTLLDKAKIKALSETGVHSVSVSLDSADASMHDRLRGQKGAYKATVRAIEQLAANPKKKPKLRINTVVTSQNADGLPAMHEFVRSLGGEVNWKLIPVDPKSMAMLLDIATLERLAKLVSNWEMLDDRHPFGRSPREFEEYAKGRYGFSRSTCRMPWLHLFVDPSGFCYPCCMARGKSRPMGKYPEDDIGQILYGDAAGALKMSMAAGRGMKVCMRCDDFIKENTIINTMTGGTYEQQ